MTRTSLPANCEVARGWVINLLYECRTYTANLCPLWGRAESANLGEDFVEPIRKTVEAAPRRAI
jgi:hypothetical protein